MPFDKSGSRLYFPNAAASAAGVTPAYDASWAVTNTAVRRKLTHKPTNDGGQGNTRGITETSATAFTGLVDQYISDPLPFAKSISGSVMITAQARTSYVGGTTSFFKAIIKVVSNTGTVKATLFSGTSTEGYGQASAFHNRVVTGVLTPFDAAAGDRIVIERGIHFTNTTTSSVGTSLGCHDSYDYPDAPAYNADGGITINWRAWVEFTQPDIWGPPKPTLAGELSQVAEKPVRTPTKLSGLSTKVGAKPVRTPVKLSGMLVKALVSKTGYKPRGLYTVGFPETEPRVLLPDGRWVPFRIVDRETLRAGASGMSQSSFLGGRVVTLSETPRPNDVLFLTTVSLSDSPRYLTGPPTGLPGVTWVEAYRSLDDRYAAWFGYGATAPGTISISAYSSETYRLSTVRILRDVNPILADADFGRTLGTQPVSFSTYEGRSDQVRTLDVLAGSSNPDPVLTLDAVGDGWTVHDATQNVIATHLNPLKDVASVSASVSYQGGVTGAMYVVGGDTPMNPPTEDPLPVSRTIRYYPDQGNTDIVAPPALSSKWNQIESVSKLSLIETPRANAMMNYAVTRVSGGGSRGSIQLMTPSMVAGQIRANFRTVWAVDYIGEAYLRLIIRLISADGTVIRGDLADVTSTTNADSPTFSTMATNSLSGSLAQLTAQRGDRILIDMGFYFAGGLGGSAVVGQTISSHNGDMPFGDSVPHDNTKRPWFELIPA